MQAQEVSLSTLLPLEPRWGAPPRGAVRRPPAGLVVAALAVTALVLLPPLYLLLRAAEAPPGAWRWVLQPRTWQLLRNSLALAAAVTVSAVAVAVPVAWLVARTDLPGRRFWPSVLALPLAMPSYVGTFALVGALRPTGILGRWLAGEVGPWPEQGRPWLALEGFAGA
ncbi:MAG TPA: hypothetical protein VIL11_05205, partial [Limnochordales bacterium]